MSHPADVEINGIDMLNTYNMRVIDIQGTGPIQPVKRNFGFTPGALRGSRSAETFNPRKLTLVGTITASSNRSLNMYIELIGELIGWYGDRYAESTLKVNYFKDDGTHYGDNMIFLAVVESFDIEYIRPVFIQTACKFKLSFRVTGTLDRMGVDPVLEFDVSSNDPFVYFEDVTAKHGTVNVVHKFESTSGSVLAPAICCLATSDEFTNECGTPTTSGTHPVVEGAFGSPAINFAAAGNNTLKYLVIYNLPIEEVTAISFFIRFKRNFSIGDGNYHVLLGDNYGLSQTFIAFSSSGNSDIIWGNGTNFASVSAASVSSSAWNTLVATQSSSGMTLRLKTPTEELLGTYSGTPAMFPNPGLYFHIGTASAGNYRSDCKIDEVAIWKHPLPEAGSISAVNADFPIRQMHEQGLKRRLTFLQDFTNGYQAIANRGTYIQSSMAVNNGQLIVDSGKRTMKALSLTDYSLTDYIAYLVTKPAYGSVFPVLERYNKLQLITAGAGTQRLIIAKMGLRRL